MRPRSRVVPFPPPPRPAGAAEALTVAEVETRLGVSHWMVYQLIRSGELPSVRMGRLRRVLAEDLDAYLRRQRDRTPPWS